MPVPSLPDELIGLILIFLQPHYVLSDSASCSTPWSEGTSFASRECWQATVPRKTVHHDWQSLQREEGTYHPTISVTRVPSFRHRLPALLNVGLVCRSWRRAQLAHPFWSVLAWHRLCDFKQPPVGNTQQSVGNLDEMFRVMAAQPIRLARIRSIWLDIASWRRSISIETILGVLHLIPNPERVTIFVLEASWEVSGDTGLVRLLAKRFPSLRQIHIGGRPTTQVFHGLGSSSIKHLAKHWEPGCLTHLSLQGYGPRSFSWESLEALLLNQRNIQHLALDFVRNGLNLGSVTGILRGVRTLCINFDQIYDHNLAVTGLVSPWHVHEGTAEKPWDLSGFQELTTLVLQTRYERFIARKRQDTRLISIYSPGRPEFRCQHIADALNSINDEVAMHKLRELRLPRFYSMPTDVNAALRRLRCLQTLRLGTNWDTDVLQNVAANGSVQLLEVDVSNKTSGERYLEIIRKKIPAVRISTRPINCVLDSYAVLLGS